MADGRDLRGQIVGVAGHLDALVAHLANHGGNDADTLRRLAIAAVEVEFSARHRDAIDLAAVRVACRNALELLDVQGAGLAAPLYARAQAACLALDQRLADDV
jgi:hypothetical protein